MKENFLSKRLCDMIETEVLDLFYDYEDRYEEAYDNAMRIHNEILENNIIINNLKHGELMIAIMDISNQLGRIDTTEKILEYSEKHIKSHSLKLRRRLCEAQLLAIKGVYCEANDIYDELEDHYRKVDDDIMIGVINYQKGMYINNTKSMIEALNIYIEKFDNTKRACERVQDTYERLIKCTLSIEELIIIKELKKKITCLGVAV